MRNIPDYSTWEALNELRILASPFKLYKQGEGWYEVHRESIQTNAEGKEKEIGHISFGIAEIPTHTRWYVIINIETFPISGFGSHQIMTVHQSEHNTQEEAETHLRNHWESLQFKNIKISKAEYPTIGFSSENKNE